MRELPSDELTPRLGRAAARPGAVVARKQQLLGQAAPSHAANMAHPAETGAAEDQVDRRQAAAGEDVSIGHPGAIPATEQGPKAAHVEDFHAANVASLGAARLHPV